MSTIHLSEKDDVKYLDGVGPKTLKALISLGIKKISDLILFLPSFLINKTMLSNLDDVKSGESVLFIGVIKKVFRTKGYRPNLIAQVDIGGSIIQIRFIHKIIIFSHLNTGDRIRFSGILYKKNSLSEIIHPEIEKIKEGDNLELVTPYYKTKKIISQNKIRKLIKQSFDVLKNNGNLYDIFDDNFLKKFDMPEYSNAVKYCHFPCNNYDSANKNFLISKQRFILEELFAYKFMLNKNLKNTQKNFNLKIKIDEQEEYELINNLPFKLTKSQSKCLQEIKTNFRSDQYLKRLLQGDVGSGKTIVAAFACYYVVKSGFQAAVLVPTEILCEQHYKTFKSFFSSLNINISILKSNQTKHEKDEIMNAIASGQTHIVIGTHALLYNYNQFKSLGLVVIDEQHKFGVKQREIIIKDESNNKLQIHQLFLSATPIPRSLSLVLYQGLDYSIMDEMPRNRKPISTYISNESNNENIYSHISEILKNGGQVYWVCPCINYTENIETQYVLDVYEKLSKIFNNFRVGCLHGQQSNDENRKSINDFTNHNTDILVCTTMIEVGVDSPNAVGIVIENSERFGLSQLHQLRGRVGRGDKKSYCFLVHSDKISAIGLQRLNALKNSQNGFVIAEEDLKLRGSGEYLGQKQSGNNKDFILATAQDAIYYHNHIIASEKDLKFINKNNINILMERWNKTDNKTIEL